MELSEKFQRKFQDFKRAASGLTKLASRDFSLLNEEDREIFENALIQKMEICAELSWKLIRKLLEEKGILNMRSPKDVIKQFYSNGYCPEELYEGLDLVLKDRKLMSHIYYENYFKDVLKRVPHHVKTFQSLILSIGLIADGS